MNTAVPPFSTTKTTLCFLLKDEQILLAMKKRGFGEGKWNGVGGKTEKGESAEDAITREAKEEIGVKLITLKRVATLYFHFSEEVEKLGKSEETAVFFCHEWIGEPHETEEMKPQWFQKDQLPYDKMWDDDQYWVPFVLEGKKITGEFWFDKDFKLVKHTISEA